MALNGSITTNSYDGRYYILSWAASQSVANNQSTITWSLACYGGDSWYAERTLVVTLGGHTLVSKTDRVERYAGTISSGSFTLTHDSLGNLSISGSIQAAVYTSSINCTASGSWALNQIPRQANITAAPNFNDEENPTINYSNPAGNSVSTLMACISLTTSRDDIKYRHVDKTGTSYTFYLTEEERNVLRNATTGGNSRTVYFYVRTEIGNNTFYSTMARTLTIVNGNPSFTATVKDLGGASTALTNNNQVMIKGFNYMTCSMAATAYKGASIASYKITNGGTSVGAASANFNNSESNTFVFECTDTRGNSARKTITLNMIDYVPLSCSVDGKIVLNASDGTKADLTFTISGNYFNGSFGGVNNSLTIGYTMEVSGGAWSYETIELTDGDIYGNTYSVTKTITDLSYTDSYVIIAQVSDKIHSNIKSSSKTLKATPVFDWGENDFNFNVPVTIQGVNVLDKINNIVTYTKDFAPNSYMDFTTGDFKIDASNRGAYLITMSGDYPQACYGAYIYFRSNVAPSALITLSSLYNTFEYNGSTGMFRFTYLYTGGGQKMNISCMRIG